MKADEIEMLTLCLHFEHKKDPIYSSLLIFI